MADSKLGSKSWVRALETEFTTEPTFWPAWAEFGRKASGWFCGHDSVLTHGYGRTIEEAYVDYVEEAWCVLGDFPECYPD
jgi:hypothetical protein